MNQDFLVEIGTEELPPTALSILSDAFAQSIRAEFARHKLTHGEFTAYATPRRLALLVKDLPETTPMETVAVWGPPAAMAFDDQGQPTKAALGFAKKNGVAPDALQVENDGKADKLVCHSETGGTSVAQLLPDVINRALAELPIAKRMRWGASRAEFVRPVHWVVLLVGNDVVQAEILGVPAGRHTYGHRFHHNSPIELTAPSRYQEALRETGRVMASFEERRDLVRQQVLAAGEKLGGSAVVDDDLLDEVTALVEWPVALSGNFDREFLQVPQEALVSSMKEHQKYFHVVDGEGALLPHFITLANIESTDPAKVVAGNEKVIRPRLADAAFFFETDKKTTLEQQRERLKSVMFQAQLGTLYDKTERIAQQARVIAQDIGADADLAERAARLSKADLVSTMVYEFADMQGIAGAYYARNDGEPEELAEAMHEQYLPKFAGDALPQTSTGSIIALADRLDTLVGIFAIGQLPTGSKDPFGLRRLSLGVLRILVEKDLALDLRDLLQQALSYYRELEPKPGTVETALAYMLERFRAWYEEANISAEVFQAVSAKNLSTPVDINKRVYAVAEFSKLPEAAALAAANKRVSNILAKQAADAAGELDPKLLQEPAEQHLARELAQMQEQVAPLLQQQNYTATLATLAGLRESVDAFFDHVMVMTEDAALRQNRLALLQQLRNLFLQVADISLLAVKA